MRGLAAALSGPGAILVIQQINRWGGYHFMDKPAGNAGAIGAIPVAFDNHRPATAWTEPWWKRLHVIPLWQKKCLAPVLTVEASHLPPGLVDGFGH